MPRPSFIYFDIDDTILDHKTAQNNALRYVFETFPCFAGTEFDLFSRTYARINTGLWKQYSLGAIDRDSLQRLRFSESIRETGVDHSQAEEIGNTYMQAYRNEWTWIDGAKEALTDLSSTYKLGFITNGFSETQKLKAESFGLSDFSEHIIISEDVGHLKPSPEIFAHAEQISGSKGEQVLYVGDNFMSDIQGGNSAGWQTAWYTREQDSSLRSQANIVFSKFEELTEALNR